MTPLEATWGARSSAEDEERPYAAGARGGSRGRTGTKPDWSRAGIEPRLDEILNDPIVHLLMRRDRLTPSDVWGAIEDVRRGLARLAD